VCFLTVKGESLAVVDARVLVNVELEVVVRVLDGPNLVLLVDEVSA
jgi:hypothetical protein